MRRLLSLVAVALLVSLAGTSAQAGLMTYDITGTFGANTAGDTGLQGGSFTVTFETSSLPVASGDTGALASYTVSTFNAQGTLVYSYGDPTGDYGGIIGEGSTTFLYFGDTNPNSAADLNLTFGPGFDGTGSIVVADYNLYQDYNGDQVQVASAVSSAAVPEPSSIVLCGIAGAIGLAVAGCRRKRAA